MASSFRAPFDKASDPNSSSTAIDRSGKPKPIAPSAAPLCNAPEAHHEKHALRRYDRKYFIIAFFQELQAKIVTREAHHATFHHGYNS